MVKRSLNIKFGYSDPFKNTDPVICLFCPSLSSSYPSASMCREEANEDGNPKISSDSMHIFTFLQCVPLV